MQRTGDRLIDFAIDFGFETRNVTAVDGTRLRVLVRPALGKPRVVLLHGFPQNAAEWRQVASRLGDEAQLVMPDLRGFGKSELSRSGRYDLDTVASDVEAIDAQTRDLDPRPFHLVAHDWGGPIAWRLLERRPELVAHHVSINAPHFASYAKSLWSDPAQRRGGWYTALFQLPGVERLLASNGAAFFAWGLRKSSPKGLFTDEDLELYVGPLRDPARLGAGLAYYRAGRSRLASLGKRAADAEVVRVPTIILWGTRDPAIAPSVLEDMSRRICPGATVRELAGVSHWVPDQRPGDVADAIREGLRGA